jgi:hypothetical protein
MRETGTFVVQVLAAGDRHLAERFAESARGQACRLAGQRAADGSEPAQLQAADQRYPCLAA